MSTCCKNSAQERPAGRRFLARFRRDEDGGIIIFSLFIFVLMLWFTGMSIDLMRFETTRTKVQGTLDRAVLAAADLDQELPPADVVKDYFEKAGMLDFLDGEPAVDEGINYRVVSANAKVTIPMMFADLPRVFMQPFSPGIYSSLTVSGGSTAEERVSDVEVSLVLDVSSSMQNNNRFTNLVPAAHDFIDTVLANNTNAPEGLITVSMIPYSAVVNTGPEIASVMDLVPNHTYSTCPRFEDDLFETTELDLDDTYDIIAHFDYGAETQSNVQPITRPWCFVGEENEIVVHSSDPWRLKSAVSNLTSFGNTAIDMGMKWGVALLDPSTEGIVDELIVMNQVESIADDRPLEWGTPDVLKVVVLMTDGENTTEYDLSEPYKTGMSTIWFWREYEDQPLHEVPEDRISIQYEGMNTPWNNWDDEFFHLDAPHWDRWDDHPRGTDRDDYRSSDIDVEEASAPGEGIHYEGDVFHASWQDIYANWVRTRIYNTFFNEPYSRGAISYSTYVATYYALDAVVNGSQADDRLSDICEEARDAGVVIYTVAFEAPSGGQDALLDCASSPSHYFDVAGTDISDAFSAIASDIRQLKLTR